jgi:hypothetical protein
MPQIFRRSANTVSKLSLAGTRPRTTYLAIVRNPNTGLEPPGSRTVGGEGH